MEKQKNMPVLRFPEFEGDNNNSYNKYLFRDIFLFSTGKNIKQNEASPDFETPCVRYGELYHLYNEVIYEVINKTNIDKSELLFSQGDEILLPSAGEDPLDIGSASALTIENVAIGRTINILKPMKAKVYSQIYVSYYINQKLRKKISTLAKGVSISNVYNSDLKTLEIILPKLPEQQKIATFFTAIDRKISQLKKKKELLEQYKKGVMQKIFKQEIRFRDDNGNEFPKWEKNKLKECLETISSRNFQIKTTDFKSAGKYRVIDQGQTLIAGYFDEESMVFKNTPIIVFGDHTTAIKYIDFEFIIGADGVKLLKNKAGFGLKYLFYNLKYNNVSQEGYKRHFSILSKVTLQIPSLPEQTKIANFLSAIDDKISHTQKQIENAEEWKKGLMQRMFV